MSDPRDLNPRRIAWLRWLLAVLFLAAIVGYYASGLSRYVSWEFVRDHRDILKAWVQQHLLAGLLLFFLTYLAMAALSLPAASILTMLAGALFDLWLGIVVVSVASTLGATLAFLSSRYLFRDWVQPASASAWRPSTRASRKTGRITCSPCGWCRPSRFSSSTSAWA